MPNPRFLPIRVRLARIEAHMSQDQLAVHLGYKAGKDVSLIETGKRPATSTHLEVIARVTNKPITYFFADENLPVDEAAHA